MFYYNGVDLEMILKVISIDTTLVSNRKNTLIDIPSKHGQIYRSFKYGAKEIKIKCDLKENSDIDLYDTLDSLSSIFDVDEPKPLKINDTGRVYFAVLDGGIDRERICKGMERLELNFICPDPYSYNPNMQIFNGDKTLSVENKGNIPTPAIFNINFQNDARYIQINNDNGESLLIGSYPKLEKTVIEEKTPVLTETCETTSNFTTASSGVDVDRTIVGTISPNSGGSSYCIEPADFGSGDKWHGPALRLNLPSGATNIADFEVNVRMCHNSKGVLEYNQTCETNKITTTKYKVTAKTVSLKESRSSSSKTLISIKKDIYLQPTEVTNGWIKTTYNSKIGWIKISTGLKKVTVTTANYYTTQSVSLRSSASKSSKLLLTIPGGEVVIAYPNTVSNKYMKCKYKDITGYIYSSYLAKGSSVSIETDKEYDIAENKVGLVECYGYSQTGTKLFRLGLYDVQDYFESTYPVVQVGNIDFLKDDTFQAPEPKTRTSTSGQDDDITIKVTTLNSGKYGSWNEFDGRFVIRREGGKWTAKIIKYENEEIVKSLESDSPKQDTSFPTESLNHLVFYFAAYGSKPNCDTLAVNHIEVNRLNEIPKEEVNLTILKAGDNLNIDCANNKVYKNNQLFMEYVDIGSKFFEVPVGETTYKILSDDSSLTSCVIFNERWLN